MATQVITNGAPYNNSAGSMIVGTGGSSSYSNMGSFLSLGSHSFNAFENQERNGSVATGINGVVNLQTLNINNIKSSTTGSYNVIAQNDVNIQNTIYAPNNKDDGAICQVTGAWTTLYWMFDWSLINQDGNLAGVTSIPSTGYALSADYASTNPSYAMKINSTIQSGVL